MKVFLRFFYIVWRDKLALFSLVILLFWVVVATLPFFVDVLQMENVFPSLRNRLRPVEITNVKTVIQGSCSFETDCFILGTDTQGVSVLVQIINGAKTSLLVSLCTVLLCLVIGIPLGAAAGFFGGWIDIIISRIIDTLLAFPPLILPIAITAFFQGGFWHVVVALSVTGWVSYARLVRGQFLALREREFVVAALALGASDFRIMARHILPNALSPIVVQAVFALAGVIISEAGLSFLGLGVHGNYVSWGGMLNIAGSYLSSAPHLAFVPALALFSVVASLNFLGEALRLAFDPKSLGQMNM